MVNLMAIVQRVEPKADKAIIVVAGEHKILEIKKHWAASIWPMSRLVVASVLMVFNTWTDSWLYWVIFPLCLTVTIQALWSVLAEFRDRFVITNQRIFRLNGVIGTNRASIPISRILDITAKKTMLGKIFDYGHFIFESAAQVQGLNEVKYVRGVDEKEQILLLAIKGEEMHEMVSIAEDDGT